MSVLKKQDAPAPIIPQPRTIEVPELGGEVVLRPLLLSDRLAMSQDAATRAKDFAYVATLLSHMVVDADGEPLYTIEQWEAWGATHVDAAMRIFGEAWQFSGLGSKAREEAEKKSKAQNSG